MSQEEITRREFVAASSVGAGGLAMGAQFISPASFGANDRIRLGIAGAGQRAAKLMNWAHNLEQSHNVQFTAVCDIWKRRRDRRR